MPYDQRYEIQSLRGIEVNRPWDLPKVIKRYIRKTDSLLDIGCGTAYKLLGLAGEVGQIYGLEPNANMRSKALQNIKESNSGIILVAGIAEQLPFKDNSFDIVTCMVAPHKTSEVRRVLRPGGYAILEKIDVRDKFNLKEEFGFDEEGPRGMFSEMQPGQRAKEYEVEFSTFSEAVVTQGFWTTYYTLEGLALILEQTPMIRNFDRIRDQGALERIQQTHSTPHGIETTQNRILIVAKK